MRAWRRRQGREAPLVDFQNREDFEKWLEGKPREVAVALAVRVALRVLPIAQKAESLGFEGDFPEEIVLPVFRSVSAGWFSAKFQDHATNLTSAAAMNSAGNAYADYAIQDAVGFSAANSSAAAAAAAHAAFLCSASPAPLADAVHFAADAVDCAFAAALNNPLIQLHPGFFDNDISHEEVLQTHLEADISRGAAATFWAALPDDTARIEGEFVDPAEIAASPLWPRGQPPEIAKLWQAMKRDLLAAGEDWEVWTDWYDARLRGDPAIEELEVARAMIPDEMWKQGPAVVNKEIKRLIEKYKAAGPSPDPPPQQKKFVGFFSYAHIDARVDPNLVEAFSSEVEKRVDAKIVNATFEMWRDNTKLRSGDFWDETIERAIRSADAMVVLLTPKWISSDYCRKEFGVFREQEGDRGNGSFVIPIYARNIDTQLDGLVADQRGVYDDLMRRQHKRISPTELGLLSEGQRVDLIERIADDIVLVLSRRRAGEPARPRPVQGVVSPTSFDWTSRETISVGAGPANWPTFPFPNSEKDHANRLEASRIKATDIVKALKKQRWNARPDYLETLENYSARLPATPRDGNFILAENEYQVIRALFASEAGFLPDGLAAQLGMFVTNHTALRAYYPDAAEFIESARRGSLEPTLPLEAFEGLSKVLQKHTPTEFEPEVGESFGATVQPIPAIARPPAEGRSYDPGPLAPPPDPIGEIDPEKSHRLTMASWVNELVKVVESGDKKKGAEGWRDVANEMAPFAAPIIQFLRHLLGG